MGSERPGLIMNTLTGATVGAIYGSVVSAWIAPKIGKLDGVELGVESLPSFRTMTRHVGGQAALFAGVAAAFSVGEAAGATMHGKDDVVSAIAGGATAGLVLGARTMNFGHGAAFVLGFGLLSGVTHMAHGSFTQDKEAQEKRLKATRV